MVQWLSTQIAHEDKLEPYHRVACQLGCSCIHMLITSKISSNPGDWAVKNHSSPACQWRNHPPAHLPQSSKRSTVKKDLLKSSLTTPRVAAITYKILLDHPHRYQRWRLVFGNWELCLELTPGPHAPQETLLDVGRVPQGWSSSWQGFGVSQAFSRMIFDHGPAWQQWQWPKQVGE